jgi:hypothetical protein
MWGNRRWLLLPIIVTSLPSSSLLWLAVRLAAFVDIMTCGLGLIGGEASSTSKSSLSTSSSDTNVKLAEGFSSPSSSSWSVSLDGSSFSSLIFFFFAVVGGYNCGLVVGLHH